MSELARMASEYYRLGGYRITRQTPAFFEAETADPNASPARVFVWADDALLAESQSLSAAEKAEREAREKGWLQRFSVEMRAAPGVLGYFLVPQRRGLSTQFISDATKVLRGGVRVPIQFFDQEYRYDEGGKRAKASVAGAVFESAARLKRVPQPFFRRSGLAESEKEPVQGDLVTHLEGWLAKAGEGPRFCLIDGSAGGGKTVAFNALATSAYKAFIERKLRQGKEGEADSGTAGRPVIFLPQHLRSTGDAGHIDDVMAAAADTDMAAPITPERFRWLLANGFSLWMFDGLDEFYEGSKGFFNELAAILDKSGSRACILICTRDSLLTSSAALRAFVETRLAGRSQDTEILELAPWGETAWNTIAAIELGQGAKAQKFVTALARSPITAELARLPFYCSVLIERFRDDGDLPASEFALLDTIFERMISREHGKAVFRWQDFVDEDLLSDAIEEEIGKAGGPGASDAKTRLAVAGLLDEQGKENVTELLAALAHIHRRAEAAAISSGGLEAPDIKELTDSAYIKNDMQREEHVRRLTALVQFAFFGAGRRAGTVDFTHPILADYLAARYALILLRRGAAALPRRDELRPSEMNLPKAALQQAVGTAPLDTSSIFFRYIAAEAAKDGELREFLKTMSGVTFDRPVVSAFMQAILSGFKA
jgi:hypothetical protein